MPVITLPDGSQRHYENALSVYEVAADIGAGLAKAALAGIVNDVLVDLSTLLSEDTTLAIVTAKDKAGLEIIRHSAAHLLAQAVKQLYPEVQVTIGPVIENGFYYDFAGRAFSTEDLAQIEARMQTLVDEDLPVQRTEMVREDAIDHFNALGEHYKVEIIESIPEGEVLSFYHQGDFTDLCRGPHVPSTRHLKAFKLMKVAGAYWRGDAKNAMLQRIYGTAWADKKALKAYLHQLEEAEKRDHRKIAKQLNLFHQQPEAPGMVFWHPRGWQLNQTVVQYIRSRLREFGYQEINTPLVVDNVLWEQSGHAEKFIENMFLTSDGERPFAIKPMNCPCHIQVFNQGIRSYRELPVRYAEFGCCHRNESSGSLHGLMRVRSMVQDDGHIFCREDQIEEEVAKFTQEVFRVYQDFGFSAETIEVKLALRPEQRIGTDETWDHAEASLRRALASAGVKADELPGEGAFYGPKVEFHLRDCIGRDWQCGTLQLDYLMPERLGALYVAADDQRRHPVMLHRAMLGSVERFIGILLEHYEGKLPLWLAPEQVVVMTLTDRQTEYAQKIAQSLTESGFFVKLDLRNEKIGYKIREHTLQRIPYQLVLGDQELASDTVAVRTLAGKDLGRLSLEALVTLLKKVCQNQGVEDQLEELSD